MCLSFDRVQPPTVKAKEGVTNLQIVAFIHLSLIFIKLIVILDLGSLFEVFILIILWSAWVTLSHCLCIFYIIFCLYHTLLIFVFFATRIQNGKSLLGDIPKEQAVFLIYLICFFFYIVASYIAFLAYREFKAIYQDQERTNQNQYGYQQPSEQASANRYDEESSKVFVFVISRTKQQFPGISRTRPKNWMRN